jgi:ATP synthase protein I
MEPAANKNDGDFFSNKIAEKEKRKLKAQQVNSGSVWSGFGMFGMVGWSVATPTLLGTALGVWLDKKHPESFSWTLSCLIVGLSTGCVIAWYWVSKNNQDE